jgi:hypothetical protein
MRSILAALILCTCALASPASAHSHHHHYARVQHRVVGARNVAYGWSTAETMGNPRQLSSADYVAGAVRGTVRKVGAQFVAGSSDDRPRDCYGIAWCGCYMRHLKGVADRAYNLASNWAHWGQPSYAHPGAVVVWRGHVGEIVGECSGTLCPVLSGNFNNRVAVATLSIANVIAIRE